MVQIQWSHRWPWSNEMSNKTKLQNHESGKGTDRNGESEGVEEKGIRIHYVIVCMKLFQNLIKEV